MSKTLEQNYIIN